jgi:PadR family transcriptional regulator, regulatory protein PadR
MSTILHSKVSYAISILRDKKGDIVESLVKHLDLDLVLLATLEPNPLYGLEILKEVNLRTHGLLEFKGGSLYPALHRLVKAGWVETYWQPSNSGGAPRKYYRLSDSGLSTYEHKKRQWSEAKTVIEALLERMGFESRRAFLNVERGFYVA